MIIGIFGFARTGKDTFASILSQKLKTKKINSYIFNLAYDLKDICNKITVDELGINCHNLTDNQKKIIRPFMVNTGELFRSIDEDYWIKKVQIKINKISDPNAVYIIPDVRFQNEANWILSDKKNKLVLVDRTGVFAPNSQELKNIPLIKKNYIYKKINWPEVDMENELTKSTLYDIVDKYIGENFYEY